GSRRLCSKPWHGTGVGIAVAPDAGYCLRQFFPGIDVAQRPAAGPTRMKKNNEHGAVGSPHGEHSSGRTPPKDPNRRQFLGRVSGIATAAASVGAIGLESLVGAKESAADASVAPYIPGSREAASFD